MVAQICTFQRPLHQLSHPWPYCYFLPQGKFFSRSSFELSSSL
ncbi:unnamed protein product [Pocillopora meandrina]|uniref:Uncharacterized protein n=1 Tax=Pocillopora meandrina TaxID=46732 RepID=A0AAU9XWR6_9CNID|nr:unnamed protein product [Pocillopora meandrina]